MIDYPTENFSKVLMENLCLISASRTIEQESEFWLACGSEDRVTVVLCDTFEFALEPEPRAR